ncbi:unnamed protein product [Spirodela intermedia]|uniref:Uncharacterized protein n=1 Tax=Spirodela intermedia TaxID=51605 RepID=A0A7I8LK56_SPIIN|nr:unnamed protein product [Spirodela intermedia]
MEEALENPSRRADMPLLVLLALLFAVTAAFGLCASAVLRRKCGPREDPAEEEPSPLATAPAPPRWGAVKEALMSSLRWSRSRKLGESEPCGGQGVLPLLGAPLRRSGGAGAGSLDSPAAAAAGGVVSSSPLWQRRILMGERCELPRFSGLILYDERGFPLRISADPRHCTPRVKPLVTTTATTTTSTTTLRDLL